MNKTKNILLSIIVLIVVSFTIYKKIDKRNVSETTVTNINDIEDIQRFMQGKWSYEVHTGNVNETLKYRFEIVGKTLKIWSDIGNVNDEFDMSGQPKVHDFILSDVTRDVDGHPCRYLQFDESNVSLTYRALSPIWVMSDKTTEMRSDAGIPYWRRDWK